MAGKLLYTQSRFAAMAGVARSSIAKAVKGNGKLAEAFDGQRVDASHPQAVEYLQEKKGSPELTEPPSRTPPPKKAPGGAAVKEAKKAASRQALAEGLKEHPQLGDIGSMTINEILSVYGTETAFIDWLKATKAIEDIEEKRLKNAEKRGELVNRDLIKRGVIDTINETHARLLTDGAKTISATVAAASKIDTPAQEMERMVADQITKFIKPSKSKMARVLSNA